ncbi:MAG: cupin domain-containing protein [Thiohalomonadales bacterium]
MKIDPELKTSADIVTISSPKQINSVQKLPYFVGISNITAGAKGLSMNMVVIPPGASAEPHYHDEFETGIYLISGSVETFYGDDLQNSVINKAGDFIFIPPDLYHQPINLSKTQEARAIIVRNSPHEKEAVLHQKPS